MSNEMYPSGALLLLGTLLKKKGHSVKVVHMVTDKLTDEDILPILRDFNPHVAGITVSTFQTRHTKNITRLIKTNCEDIQIVIGGSHPSALKENALADFPYADVAVSGEGELAIGEIVDQVPLSRINGVSYRENSRIVCNPRSSQLQELDNLPFPDLGFVDIRKYSGPEPVGRRPGMFIMASRGCPFGCVFCSKSIYGNTVRYHSPEYVLSQVEYLHKDFGIREIFFQDDTFNLNRSWAETILLGIIKRGLNRKMIFRTPFRVNERLVDIDLLKLMKEAGFWLIFYGVENGNQMMLDRMKKGITIPEIKRAFRLTREAGIKAEASFIIGLPGETEETIQDSIRLWREIKPFHSGFSRAIPFPDTPFEKEVREEGHMLYTDYDEYSYGKTMVRTEALTAEQLEVWAQYCGKLVSVEMAKMLLTNPATLIRTIGDLGFKGVINGIVNTARNLLAKPLNEVPPPDPYN